MLDEPNLNWQLDLLVNSLVLLSSPAEKQLILMEPNDIPLTMSVDFDCSYLDHRGEFIGSGVLRHEQVETIDNVDEC